MKKAQINHIFGIIFAVIIIVTIVIIATKSIGGLLQDKCNADYIEFKNDIKTAFDKSKDYGVVDEYRLIAPCNFHTLCFIDAESMGLNSGYPETLPYQLRIVMDNAMNDQSEVLRNVFLFDGEEVRDTGLIEDLRIEEENKDYHCIPIKNGRFTFILQGRGRYVNLVTQDIS
ncbi:MAG: hypothetical protein AB7V77_03180 [Candidatus Woesearchaeota archaeon]